MGLGILEDKHLDHVPGTVLLDDQAAHSEDVTGNLKHGTGRYSHIVLSPQPSEDPNDPLNWPRWKKEVHSAVLLLGALLHASTIGTITNASFVAISITMNKDLTTVVLTTSYWILTVACTGPFVCAIGRKYGKRLPFVFSSLMGVIGCAIIESKISYHYLLAGRIVQGFSSSCYESLIIASIGDLYFVHERGFRIGIINFVLMAGSSLSSIIAAQIYNDMGYLWNFHLLQIFVTLQLVLVILFVPESTYLRDDRYNTDSNKEEKIGELLELENVEKSGDLGEKQSTQELRPVPPKKTFSQELALYTGVYSRDNIIKYLAGPFVMLLNPAACFSILGTALIQAWFVGTAIMLAGVFFAPPYLFDTAQVGYLGTGPFVGGIIGTTFIILLGDAGPTWLARRNKGIYEPEMRLIFMIPGGILMGIGLFFFGHVLQTQGSPYAVAVLQGVLLGGMILSSWSMLAYALDAFRGSANEIFVMNMTSKNFLFYGLSSVINDWIASDGPFAVMSVFASTSIFIALMALPVYIFGKRLRSWWSRNDLLVKWHLVTKEVGGSFA